MTADLKIMSMDTTDCTAMEFRGDFASYEKIRNEYGSFAAMSFLTTTGPNIGDIEIRCGSHKSYALPGAIVVKLKEQVFAMRPADFAQLFGFQGIGAVSSFVARQAQQGVAIPQAIPIPTPPDFFNSEPTTAPAPVETTAQRMGRIMKDVAGGR